MAQRRFNIQDRAPRWVKAFGNKISQWRNVFIFAGIVCFLVTLSVFLYFYLQFSREIDARLSGQVFDRASLVFSAPTPIQTGETATPEELAARLRRALYSQGESGSKVGTYSVSGERLEIRPGPLSYFATGPQLEGAATVEFEGGKISSIKVDGQDDGTDKYLLEPEPVTTLFDGSRTKRRVIKYQDLPPVLVNAVLAAEDRRFFSHHGVNVYRIFQAAWKDVWGDERLQGGSTLTMQLARNFFLTPKRTLSRKVQEIFLALVLEQRLSKEQILELYSNEVYLGQRGSFAVDGFAAGAEAYFNRDVKGLSLPQAALLAALIRGPNLYTPYRHPQAALRVRNYVLHEMKDDGFITAEQEREASDAALNLAPQNVEGSQAPYFVDMVKDQLLSKFSERDLISQSYRVYTTLDPDLQRVASESVKLGMDEVDEGLSHRHHAKDEPPRDPNQPQVAMVVLDPHSGDLLALVGGRDYAVSQLNHALAKRQPGSSFKPFVYAAALNSAITGSQPLVTPATTLMDEPTTFEYDDKVYEPRNYKEEYHGPVTLREALSYSLNCATVSLAQMIGYDKVRDLAIQAGINKDLLATPALALGSYDATPLEIASAYTMFSNGGLYTGPRLILTVRDDSGQDLWQPEQTSKQVLDPRVTYQMVNLMETVLDHGTGAGVRSRGFVLPAAGKTGTSHDGWFAGFTTNLLAVVWVGYDDNRELGLSGSASALPVWTDFMKSATKLPDYHGAGSFTEPAGLVTASIKLPDPDPSQPFPRAAYPEEIFVEGTEPHGSLAILSGARSIFSRILGLGGSQPTQAAPKPVPALPPSAASQAESVPPSSVQSEVIGQKKKPNVVKRFFSIFKHGGPKSDTQAPAAASAKDQDNPTEQE